MSKVKSIGITILLAFLIQLSTAQTDSTEMDKLIRDILESTELKEAIIESDKGDYKLFPTQNKWTFIKLDTRYGKLWQVHFSVTSEDYSGQLIINDNPLIFLDSQASPGRFTIYPTENIYNFLMLDQRDGRVFQVQWSPEPENRGIWLIE